MRPYPSVLIVWLALTGAVTAEPSDETLRYYLARSPLCVVGRIETEPVPPSTLPGIVRYRCDVQAIDVLSGTLVGPKVLRIDVVRLETAEADRLPYLKIGQECILFLKRSTTDAKSWETADCWFGVQPHGPALAGAIRRLAAAKGTPAKGPLKANTKPLPRPALDLTEAVPRLAGRWLMRLPAGATYVVELRQTEGRKFNLQKAVRFSGDYEIRDNRLVLVKASLPSDAGFAWELREFDEMTLVDQPPKIGTSYLGATMKRQDDLPPEPVVAPPKAGATAASSPVGPENTGRRWPLYLTTAVILSLLSLWLALWLRQASRRNGDPETPISGA